MTAGGPSVPGHAVFAYGSNMHLGDLRCWLGRNGAATDGVSVMGPALLPGYRLVWTFFSEARGGGAASVEAAEGCSLPGVVLATDRPTFAAIARKEGYPHRYRRFMRRVERLDAQSGSACAGGLEAWVYQVRPTFRKDERVPPTSGYLRLLIEAAESFQLPECHIEDLKKIPTTL